MNLETELSGVEGEARENVPVLSNNSSHVTFFSI